MKFLGILTVVFSVVYAFIGLHYINFDDKTRSDELENISKKVKDVRASIVFKSPKYKEFVYGK
ncbi:hypothetical protein CCAL9344_00425 [Campylobacter sp. RM9344]|uniref:Uncharacterized protein n=1 Tax=Campylobacter californiensis TaxID=1032243 RepID=A0AAW3ZRD8_9BACT|nr:MULTISPECIES: hypothetical protein [unclassified Campylobacter]MBE2983815.1 hypothetical protein [Campylobacter sp. RM6883]MBE2985621.1 hypothetical protein [Campylobacter sp. RM12919]MBE2987350.1 hypothetical protein [Campylobacter sp. RM12920]MBE2994353.1 hypothetical protein [Campylobacter sp. RM6913]MBE3022187.1 hypothetical protein [Campylobacter sp. 7477a]MBE3028661.1 hypothetical protein [Campylobacter sp. RM9344]